MSNFLHVISDVGKGSADVIRTVNTVFRAPEEHKKPRRKQTSSHAPRPHQSVPPSVIRPPTNSSANIGTSRPTSFSRSSNPSNSHGFPASAHINSNRNYGQNHDILRQSTGMGFESSPSWNAFIEYSAFCICLIKLQLKSGAVSDPATGALWISTGAHSNPPVHPTTIGPNSYSQQLHHQVVPSIDSSPNFSSMSFAFPSPHDTHHITGRSHSPAPSLHNSHGSSTGTSSYSEATPDSVVESNFGQSLDSEHKKPTPDAWTQKYPLFSEIPVYLLKSRAAAWKGGFGIVYKAKLNDQVVAMKTLSGNSNDFEREFAEEWKVVRTLLHKNIVKTLHYFHDRKTLTMGYVMELMDESLKEHLTKARRKNQKIPLQKVLFYAIEIVKGLSYLHDNKKVHNDLKPANVLLRGTKEVKLCDFGAVRMRGSTAQSSVSSSQYTLAYVSPERMKRGKYHRSADIYSFGVMLNEMLTGEEPFAGKTHCQIMCDLSQEQRPKPAAEIPVALNCLIAKCWAQNPDERPPAW
eukprot:CAMPEP_0117436518 /NCGR_PEP_ID=MMETSP0759-20121206/1048_1 /TAXON_ID=63605 /ORGANISM="Percolomonas cosmopolitus, Strain WS" /LENGTH=520 /DNA_ID=CAMNT_0005228119 /DNA_START=126 /DNA_END=1686 /DNA_ORIENTATION=-